MNIIFIICIIVAIIASISLLIVIIYNKFQWIIIKLNKGESNISNFLEIKYNTLMRQFEFIKTKITIDNDDFEEYKLFNTKISIDKLNKNVNDLNNIINRYMDNNENLYQEETITKINEEIKNINISINSCKKYYNKQLIKYNQLCNSFPSKIVAKIFKYKEKKFIDEDTPNTLKILNQES